MREKGGRDRSTKAHHPQSIEGSGLLELYEEVMGLKAQELREDAITTRELMGLMKISRSQTARFITKSVKQGKATPVRKHMTYDGKLRSVEAYLFSEGIMKSILRIRNRKEPSQ